MLVELKVFIVLTSILIINANSQELFPVTIIHLNDMHARFDESNVEANVCKPGNNDCIGGYARIVTKVKELLQTKAALNPLYLNAADNFQGTLWYNMFRWNVTSYMLNLLPADAMTIGNHEFDDGIEGLVPFLEASRSPILISNIDDTLEPTFQNMYTKSMVITKYGRPIGIIGVTTTFRSNWGQLNILPEAEAVKVEAERLKSEGVDIIIVLSHCGLDPDREIAVHGGPIDIIVGGHSHSFLWSGENPPGPDGVVSSYPTIQKQDNGRDVLIVQASAYNKYLGDITLYFDEAGEIQDYEGSPIYMSHDIPQDPEILAELIPWKVVVDQVIFRHIGDTKYEIPRNRCYSKECPMGNLMADTYAYAFLHNNPDNEGWTGASIALVNPGGIRAGLSRGDIVYGDIITTTPFENSVHNIELQGKFIRQSLEFSVANNESLILLQVSGLKVVYNMANEANNRIVSLDVLCRVCDVPRYEPIDDEKFYRLAMPDFLAGGGDGFTMIGENKRNTIVGPLDIDALENFIYKNSPMTLPFVMGRIMFL
ncbi:CLUMA_CG000820, isoform A [Clunio marinus]|uniref:apyrase n=1 Tax=Clunio marinus TaxID=568069 RepID=A0A1J1HLE0_9DIPT|nr:CLUMA_CG000820, isoform A [Clunio marinus]